MGGLKHKSSVSLSKPQREKAVSLLQARLFDAIDLMMQCKQAHWNVRGPQFISLHELFDKTHGEIEEHVDSLAERAAALGAAIDGTVRMVAKGTSLKEYPENLGSGMAHVRALSAAIAAFGKATREAIDTCDEFDDATTADLFTNITRSVDQTLWMIEAHLQSA